MNIHTCICYADINIIQWVSILFFPPFWLAIQILLMSQWLSGCHDCLYFFSSYLVFIKKKIMRNKRDIGKSKH